MGDLCGAVRCGAVINNLDEKSTVMDDDLEQAALAGSYSARVLVII